MKCIRPWAVLLMLFGSAACDSAVAPQEAPGPTPDPGVVEVVRALADTSFYTHADAIALDLDTYFRQTAEHPLRYVVSSEGGSVVVITTGERNQHVQIQPAQVGRARVDVKATDPLGQAQAESFEVEVLDPCPRSPSEGEADYFPIAVGETWRFDYIQSFYGSNGSTRSVGTLMWTIESTSTCWGGSQGYTVHDQFVGTSQYYRDDIGEWVDTGAQTWSKTFIITLADSVGMSDYFNRSFLRIHPLTAADTLAFDTGGSGVSEPAVGVKLVRDVGLVSRGMFYSSSPSGFSEGLFILVSKE